MKRLCVVVVLALLILAPTAARAQFEGLRFSELPAVGSWAEYHVLRRNDQSRVVTSLKVSFLSRVKVATEEYFWFQIESEEDGFGPKRVPLVVQFALTREDALSGEILVTRAKELIAKVGDSPAFRVPKEYVQLFDQKKLLSGGEKQGGGIEYSFRDLESEKLKVKAGEYLCERKKGLGKAEIVLDHKEQNPPRYPVDDILELWLNKEVPFATVRQSHRLSGRGPEAQNVSVSMDTEEVTDLVAFGTGARSAINGKIVEYDVASALKFNPSGTSAAVPPASAP